MVEMLFQLQFLDGHVHDRIVLLRSMCNGFSVIYITGEVVFYVQDSIHCHLSLVQIQLVYCICRILRKNSVRRQRNRAILHSLCGSK